MAAKRGRNQARRNTGNSGGMPGWAWLVLGIVLTIAVVLAVQRYAKTGNGDGFFRPTPNPDAKPAATSDSDDDAVAGDGDALPAPAPKADTKRTQYDFYKMLPGDEVQMSDAEIAATEREEAAHKRLQQSPVADAGATTPASVADAGTLTQSTPAPAPPASSGTTPDAPYLLQAGAFGASGDAEATKAKLALLGLSARVESAQINGRTVYRVRMGPYSTASDLAEAKRKLANGGLPGMAIKVK